MTPCSRQFRKSKQFEPRGKLLFSFTRLGEETNHQHCYLLRTDRRNELVLVRQGPPANDRVCKPHGWGEFYLQTGFTELPVSCDLLLPGFSYIDLIENSAGWTG
jgi:hypothetical protein